MKRKAWNCIRFFFPFIMYYWVKTNFQFCVFHALNYTFLRKRSLEKCINGALLEFLWFDELYLKYIFICLGNFSFGCLQKFRSNTIVDFIDSAVAHSRSGRYLFFLHRRPILGPMRVQLLHPVSRFKQVQSLQHMCR